MSVYRKLLISAGLVTIASPAFPQPRDLSCSGIVRTEDGKFTYGSMPGFSVVRSVNEDGPFTFTGAGNVVTIACARTELMPIVNDVKVLIAGYSLSIGGLNKGALEFVELTLVDGRVNADASRASLSDSQSRDLAKVVSKMQSVVDARVPAKP